VIDLLQINPGLWVILAGLIAALIPVNAVRKALVVLAPLLAGALIFSIYDSQEVLAGQIEIYGITLTTLRIDNLSIIWAYLFCLAGFINGIYALHERSLVTDATALIYTGAAIAGVLAGDLLTLFVFWELTAIASVFLVWRGGDHAYKAGIRYLVIQVLSGVLLLAGAVTYAGSTGGDFTFGYIGLDAPGAWLLLIAMGIKAGFPFLHMWMQDSYPKASITGTVILASFTTKFAIYALARAFPGTDLLIWIGCVMVLFPIIFAALENDNRRNLAYSINSQLGFMVIGIGIGTTIAINGVAGHVFANVIAKGLLFMSVGAVMYRTGTAKASELGGLFKSMPYTSALCLVGAGSLAAVPLFAAFVTKSLIFYAAIKTGQWIPFTIMLFGTAAMIGVTEIRVPVSTFFGKDRGHRVEEAPWNMLVAMSLAAVICVFIAWPFGGYSLLYSLLPNPTDYNPYTGDHVVFQFQLLFGVMLAYVLLKRFGLLRQDRKAEIVDADVIYRRWGKGIAIWADAMWTRLGANVMNWRASGQASIGRRLSQAFSPAGSLSQAAPSGLPAVLTAGLLLLVLVVAYLAG
jgi:multicomponent Na+:H+ antiporter subunit D